MATQKITFLDKPNGATLSGPEVTQIKTVVNNNADELNLRPAALNGIYLAENLPPVYFADVTGTGTQSDPFRVSGGGFSEAQLISWLQSRPNFAPDRVFRGDLTWVDMIDNSLEKLATPVLSFGTATGDSIPVNWTAVTNGTTYTVERASSVTFADAVVIYSGSLLTFTDIGLTPVTQYFYRVRATANGFNGSNYAVGNKTTDVAGNITPVAPTLTADDTANTLQATHSRGEAEMVCSVNNAADVALTAVAGWNTSTHLIDVGNVARAIGYYRIRTKAATGFNPSPYVSSPAFTVALPTPAAPTSPVNDNSARTFNFTYTSGYPNVTDYEYSLNSGTTWTAATVKPIVVGDIAYAISVVRVRVKAVAGVNNAGATLSNAVAFTAAPQSTIPLTSWRTPVNNGALTGNSFLFTTTSAFGGAKSNYMIPAGGTGWVEFTADAALNGGITLHEGLESYGDRNTTSPAGTASPLALDYANSRFQTWVAANDNFANPRPTFGPNTKGRIRFGGTTAYFECSTDAGATWTEMRNTPQPQVDLYVKAWSNINQTNTPINNIRGFNLTLVS
ncbi:hypothetical protein WAE58_21820 [Pedobacter panaciterrae]|uniref:Fibronectin type-III domain-containing protein n=1 Tax=Pedobacter panaciterrae TaxID=363849 RepID=A0ABU8NS53_9SPHI